MTIPTKSPVVIGITRVSTIAPDPRVLELTLTIRTPPSQPRAPEGSLQPQGHPPQPRDTGPMQQNSRTTITTRWTDQVWPVASFFTTNSVQRSDTFSGLVVSLRFQVPGVGRVGSVRCAQTHCPEGQNFEFFQIQLPPLPPPRST